MFDVVMEQESTEITEECGVTGVIGDLKRRTPLTLFPHVQNAEFSLSCALTQWLIIGHAMDSAAVVPKFASVGQNDVSVRK